MNQAATMPPAARKNLAALEDGIKSLRNKLLAELQSNPAFFGSVAINFQVTGGTIDRFRVTSDETQKCTPAA